MSEIIVTKRPETVSWASISEVLHRAHADNVRRGIRMGYPQLPPDQLREKTEGRGGEMLVALADGRLVGTAAVVRIEKMFWCGRGPYAYCFLDAVVPEYAGKGVFGQLEALPIQWARREGIACMLLDTNERNKRMLRHCRKNGYRAVDYRIRDGYHSVILVKWLDGCPYPRIWCWIKYLHKKWKRKQDAKKRNDGKE